MGDCVQLQELKQGMQNLLSLFQQELYFVYPIWVLLVLRQSDIATGHTEPSALAHSGTTLSSTLELAT